MKKEKHVTINFNEEQYKKIEALAEQDERTISNYCYIIIKKHLAETETGASKCK